MKTRILEIIKIAFLALLLSVGVGYVFASWTSAPANPPSANTDAPINVGSSPQQKTGLLSLLGGLVFNPNGSATPVPGQVMTAQDSNGTVGWGATDASLTQNGYQVFSNGLILEWGVISTSSTYDNQPKTQSFPKAFPHGAFSITVTAGEKGNHAGDKQSQWGGKILNTSQFQYYAQYENPDTGPFDLYWMATGW